MERFALAAKADRLLMDIVDLRANNQQIQLEIVELAMRLAFWHERPEPDVSK